MTRWVIPYADLALSFWRDLEEQFGPLIEEVYFPMPSKHFASGRGRQPEHQLESFLKHAPLPKAVLLNPIVLPTPVEDIGPKVTAALKHLHDTFGVSRVTVTDLRLARLIRETYPTFKITASVLMGLSRPAQILMVGNTVDAITVDNVLVRDLAGLRRFRNAYAGELRLIVNEACLPGCPHRTQHFYEMAYGGDYPQSLCEPILRDHPWLRLTGAWILPRHLHRYDGLYDNLKLAGRVTLRDPEKYLQVMSAYVHREDILPVDIGGGPASPLGPIDMPDTLFETILHCDKQCHTCTICRDYYERGGAHA
ncbi:MAG: hypothetical protein PVI59_04765 [Anaerolineae bacterium]|jgi:hypothetical protein